VDDYHPVIRKRIAQLQLELEAQAERDGHRYSTVSCESRTVRVSQRGV
jgi:hypothetical protein